MEVPASINNALKITRGSRTYMYSYPVGILVATLSGDFPGLPAVKIYNLNRHTAARHARNASGRAPTNIRINSQFERMCLRLTLPNFEVELQ